MTIYSLCGGVGGHGETFQDELSGDVTAALQACNRSVVTVYIFLIANECDKNTKVENKSSINSLQVCSQVWLGSFFFAIELHYHPNTHQHATLLHRATQSFIMIGAAGYWESMYVK